MIVFMPGSAEDGNRGADWADVGAEGIPRQCPKCLKDSIVGHGRRFKQAHDENHDWIQVRRGICKSCNRTFTFLPWFSPPYGHYSLIARSHALWGYFGEHRSLDLAAPLLKDPNRVASASTLRRWFRQLNSSERWEQMTRTLPAQTTSTPPIPCSNVPLALRIGTPFPFLQRMLETVGQRLARGEIFSHGPWVLSWRSRSTFLHILLPLRP
jgi:uncharacterized protein DUF6431